MNIGIDVDGVIMDTENWFRAYAEIFDLEINGSKLNIPIISEEDFIKMIS